MRTIAAGAFVLAVVVLYAVAERLELRRDFVF
jgi:hypothetical protein